MNLSTAVTEFQYRLLGRLAPSEPTHMDGSAYRNRSKLAALLGDSLLDELAGRTVVDFGCGEGHEALEMARAGARVIGVDIQPEMLSRARERARSEGLAERCHFVSALTEPADLVISLDSFEHFADPLSILQQMYQMLRPGGAVITSFGPTWYHPYGGHLFSAFPWAHLLFREQVLIRWRANFRTDGATKFSEVAGGLNQMTIARFLRTVEKTSFRPERIELVPIRKLRFIHNRLTREFTTALIRCKLVRPREL